MKLWLLGLGGDRTGFAVIKSKDRDDAVEAMRAKCEAIARNWYSACGEGAEATSTADGIADAIADLRETGA